ncbi:MAG: response regulator [Alphaproteobacteria bacterium]|nr:response regulator [Alphaproteobacteria bacterium]
MLFVDDDDDIRTIGRMSLERVGGWTVHLAACGAEACALARTHLPDGIILDVMMPGQDGLQTLAALRADPITASIPVIFLTAKVRSEDIDRYLGQGVTGVIRKPFDPLELPHRVRALLTASASAATTDPASD